MRRGGSWKLDSPGRCRLQEAEPQAGGTQGDLRGARGGLPRRGPGRLMRPPPVITEPALLPRPRARPTRTRTERHCPRPGVRPAAVAPAPVALVPGLVRKGGLSQHTGWRLPVGLPGETRAQCAGRCACSSRAIGCPAAAPGDAVNDSGRRRQGAGGRGQAPGAPSVSRLLQSWLCGQSLRHRQLAISGGLCHSHGSSWNCWRRPSKPCLFCLCFKREIERKKKRETGRNIGLFNNQKFDFGNARMVAVMTELRGNQNFNIIPTKSKSLRTL